MFNLDSISDILGIIQFLWPILASSLVLFGWLKFFRKKETRLFKNISRPVAVVSTEEQSMRDEVDLLNRTGLFKVDHFGTNQRNFSLISDINPRLIVIGYSPNSSTYEQALTYARSKSIPVVVYANKNRLSNED